MGTISKEEAAWLAGILDGEGCLQTGVRTAPQRMYRLCVEISNTDPRLIARITEILCRAAIGFYVAYGSWRPGHEYLRIGISGLGRVQRFLTATRPYLVAKAEQADLMLQFIAWRRTMPTGPAVKANGKGEEILAAYGALRERLMSLHRRRFSLQRLPRRASMPLDLTGLEAKV